jgi:CyaY protein
MTEREFLDACERLLAAIEDGLDRSGVDVQTERSDNILQIEFEDDSMIVVNGNAPLREIWVAARAGGLHFRLTDGRWLDTRDGRELFESLSRLVTQQSGATVALVAPRATD